MSQEIYLEYLFDNSSELFVRMIKVHPRDNKWIKIVLELKNSIIDFEDNMRVRK